MRTFGGFETREACVEEEIMARFEQTLKHKSDQEVTAMGDDPTIYWEYSCLPDTIDPRAPKAGK